MALLYLLKKKTKLLAHCKTGKICSKLDKCFQLFHTKTTKTLLPSIQPIVNLQHVYVTLLQNYRISLCHHPKWFRWNEAGNHLTVKLALKLCVRFFSQNNSHFVCTTNFTSRILSPSNSLAS